MNTDLFAQYAIDHLSQEGLEALTEEERLTAAVWQFEAGVRNSGFSGYYTSKRGDLATLVPDALTRIGATRSAAIAATANEAFGAEGPPRDHERRREALKALPQSAREKWTRLEEEYAGCEEDVDELLEQYLQRRGVAGMRGRIHPGT